MESWSAHHLFSAAESKLDANAAKNLAAYATKLKRIGLPTITTLRHFSQIVGLPYDFLRETVLRKRESANYRLFSIAKRAGGRRCIHEVGAQLLTVQRFLNSEILQNVSPHQASFAFHRDGGIRKCAQVHCGASWLLHFDLKDFFFSIDERAIYEIFSKMYYRPLLAFEFARLCTTIRLPRTFSAPLNTSKQPHSFYNHRYIGVLPQGAPTSPMLANLAAYDLDCMLQNFADSKGMTYTRYADDITFSTMERLGSIPKTQYEVRSLIAKSGFLENPLKRRVAGPGARRVVLGLLVDGSQPRLTRDFVAKLDHHLYSAQKHGVQAAAKESNFESAFGFHNHLRGLVAYSSDADPVRGEIFRKRFAEIKIPWRPFDTKIG